MRGDPLPHFFLTKIEGEQQQYLGDGVLAVDHVTHSSRMASTFCFVFITALQGRIAASRSNRHLLNEKPSIVRTAPTALVPCKSSPPITTYAIVIPLTATPSFIHRTSRAGGLGLVSPSSRCAAQGSRISAFAACCIEKVLFSVPFAVDPQWMPTVILRGRPPRTRYAC